MVDLQPGANAELPPGPVVLDLAWGDGVQLDVAALLVGADGKVRGDADMVFFNNPRAEGGAVAFSAGDRSARVDVEPSALPAAVQRVVVVASVDVAAPMGTTFAAAQGIRATATAGPTRYGLEVPVLDRGETAAVLAELYRRGDGWKVRAVGQGYASGLAGVAVDFGVDVEPEQSDVEPAQPLAAAETIPPAAPAFAVPAQAAAPRGNAISLAKGATAAVPFDKYARDAFVTVTLEWDGGAGAQADSDLDLYALFVPADQVDGKDRTLIGHRRPDGDALPRSARRVLNDVRHHPRTGAVYWNNPGAERAAPYIRLDADARTPGVETIRVTRPAAQGFVLVCAYSALGNGIGSFRSYGARAVVTDGGANTVIAPLHDDNDYSYWVVVALVDFTDPQGLAVRHIEAYSRKDSESRPVLFPDGSFAMDRGPVEFKDLGDFD
ncbi:TerD family protein [Yinghuangia seranimata]|uniref:TerD family protein n=1 Tax=Yinghuangia seranimata TaxID=408067 RepID=UPI00248C23E2|nr:TerD family protein [Yinghuangia seranimata]MDI2128496.1 TerD family protein [Yinghuangia seranimata]